MSKRRSARIRSGHRRVDPPGRARRGAHRPDAQPRRRGLSVLPRGTPRPHARRRRAPAAVDARPAESCLATPDVTMKRVLRCEKHGSRTWRGYIMCDACGRTYQTTDERRSGYAPEICRCGQCLLPPAAERVGPAASSLTRRVARTRRPRLRTGPRGRSATCASATSPSITAVVSRLKGHATRSRLHDYSDCLHENSERFD